MYINLELYRVFYFICQTGSISKAAEELYITQPAVSHAIKQLEEKLNTKLFIRTSKGMLVTKEGDILLKYVEQGYNYIINGEKKISEMQNLESGNLCIGASDTMCKYYLLPHLQRFNNAYPNINLNVTNRTTLETINLLKTGKVDIGVVNLPIGDMNEFEIITAIDIHDCFVVGEKYKYLLDNKLSIDELLEMPLIFLEKASNTRRFTDKYFSNRGYEIKPEIELGSYDILVQFAKIGLGVACVVREFVQDELAEGSIYEIKLEDDIPKRNVGILALKDVPLTAASKEFLKILVNN